MSAIDITGTALTIHAWVKFDAFGGVDRPAIGKWGAGNLQYFLMGSGTGKPDFRCDGTGGQTVATGSTTMSTGTWYALTGRKSGTGAGSGKVYLNGVEDGSVTASTTILNASSPLRFGADSFGNLLDGSVAEVAIWDIALTPDEIAALGKGVSPLLIQPQNLKGYWPLYGAGSPEPDLSGNRNNATITGSVSAANHAPVGLYVPDAGAGFSTENTVVPTIAVPFISSATSVFAPTLAASGAVPLTVPFIAATTTVYAPTIQSNSIDLPFIAATTAAYPPRLVGLGMGVSVAFADTMLEPYPTWTRIG